MGNTTILSTVEIAKAIRKEIKKSLGLNSRQVSVTSPSYCAVYVTCKSDEAEGKKNEIRKIAKEYESVDKCEFTGDILAGGNTFVMVQ